MEPFDVIRPNTREVPILISVPHCGTAFPPEIRDQYDQELIKSPDDTDWFVDKLYDFASELGITMIRSVYSRWVIDLNRDPESKPLYTDGRIITDLVPLTDFTGKSLYTTEQPTDSEIKRRLDNYYAPYHDTIQKLLTDLRTRHPQVLLWEAHSIRQFVPQIHPEKFPDLILGDADGRSASPQYSNTVLDVLNTGPFEVSHNHPFKGGFITRQLGRPSEGVHALQLEMTKVNYMDESELVYDEERAEKMRQLLQSTFEELIKALT